MNLRLHPATVALWLGMALAPPAASAAETRGTNTPGIHLDDAVYTTPDGVSFGMRLHGNPRAEDLSAVIVAVHGLSGAASDFDPLGGFLARHGYALVAYNLRGQGMDPRPDSRGDLPDYQLLLHDLEDFLEKLDREVSSPILVLGESMGALVAACSAARGNWPESVQGLVLSAPVVKLKNADPPAWQRLLFRTLFMVAPMYRLDPSTLADKNAPMPPVSRDNEYLATLENSPQKISRFTLRFFRNLITLTQQANEAAPEITLPVCTLYAGHDVFVAPESVKAFHERIGSSDKTALAFPDHYHLLFRDHDSDTVMKALLEWLSSRTVPPQPEQPL